MVYWVVWLVWWCPGPQSWIVSVYEWDLLQRFRFLIKHPFDSSSEDACKNILMHLFCFVFYCLLCVSKIMILQLALPCKKKKKTFQLFFLLLQSSDHNLILYIRLYIIIIFLLYIKYYYYIYIIIYYNIYYNIIIFLIKYFKISKYIDYVLEFS